MKKQIKIVQSKSDKKPAEALLIFSPIIIIALAYSNATVDVVLMPKYICYAVYAIIITLFSYRLAISKPENFNAVISHIFFKVYLVYLLVSFISLQSSINYADGIFEWLKLFLFGTSIFSIAVYFYNYKDLIELFTRSVTILNAIIVLIGLYQFMTVFGNANVTHSTTYVVTGTFGHKNIFAEMLFLTFPFTLYNVFTGTKNWKLLAGISSALTLFLITITLTRAVWLSTVIGLFLSFPFYFFAIRSSENFSSFFKGNKKNTQIALALLVSIFISIAVYSRFDSFATFKKQIVSITGYKYGSGGERIELWKKSVKIFKESPVLGTGLGSWKIKVLNYGHHGLETEDDKTFHQRPHNDFIWILSEQGILGLLSYLILVGIIIFSLIKLIKRSESTNEKLFYFLCLYTYFGYFIFSFFSFPKERIEHSSILMFAFAIVLIGSGRNKIIQTNNKILHFIFIPVLLITLFAINVGFERFNSEVHLQKAYSARANSQWQSVIDEINKAENKYYTIDPMCTPLSWYSGSSYYNLGNQPKAFEDFSRSYQINPNHVHVLNNLGTCYEIKGDHENAIKLYKRALEISPGFAESRLNLSATYFNAKNPKEAYKIFRSLPLDTANQKYMQMLPLIARPKVLLFGDSIKLSALQLQIFAIYNSKAWSAETYIKSIKNNISFEKQVLLEAIFLLDSTEKRTNLAYLNILRKKYKIKSKQ